MNIGTIILWLMLFRLKMQVLSLNLHLDIDKGDLEFL